MFLRDDLMIVELNSFLSSTVILCYWFLKIKQPCPVSFSPLVGAGRKGHIFAISCCVCFVLFLAVLLSNYVG